LEEVVTHTATRLSRKYNEESDIGNLFTDILRTNMGTDLAFFNSGGIRADLPAGAVTVGNMLDAFPFQDRIWKLEMTGKQVKAVLEQGFSFDRGILQCSGLVAHYDRSLLRGQRLTALEINGKPVRDTDIFTAALPGVIAEGADLYTTFPEAKVLAGPGPYFARMLEDYLRAQQVVEVPPRGRMILADQP
jgi:2',3'-cyclic-nucleotide 2'-phosphodiesterase (5'-nucleotidase family)